MPRTTTLECPGCPPLRALTLDVLGLVKVVETKGNQGSIPAVVDRWGDPDASKCVLAASINDRKSNPLLAVARKCGAIEILNPLNGNLCVAISDTNDAACKSEDDPIVGLHLFRSKPELTSGSCTLLTCTTKGKVCLRTTEVTNPVGDSATTSSSIKTWTACASGNILCSKVDSSENYAIFGGKGVEINTWDLNETTKIWTAKSPPKNSLGIFTPTWFTSATFLCRDDHRKIVAGTNRNQVRLYDISAQRRPVISFDYRETPIKAIEEDHDGYTVYVGNGSGDLASFDMRTGKMVGSFIGKCSGSIRSIARHPDLPVIASCGLDGYLRLWDIKSRQLLSAVFLKQHLNSVVFDSNFTYQAPAQIAQNTAASLDEAGDVNDEIKDNDDDDEKELPLRRKKKKKASSREDGSGGKKKDLTNGEAGEIEDDDEVELPLKRKKKKKKSSKEDRSGLEKNIAGYDEARDVNEIEDHNYDEEEAELPLKRKKKKKGVSKEEEKKKEEIEILKPKKKKSKKLRLEAF